MGVIGGRCSRRQRDSKRHHRECRLPHSHDLLEHLERVLALPGRRMNDGQGQLDRHHRLLGLRLLDYGDPWTFHTLPLAQEVRHSEAAPSRGQPPRAVSAIVTLVLKVGARRTRPNWPRWEGTTAIPAVPITKPSNSTLQRQNGTWRRALAHGCGPDPEDSLSLFLYPERYDYRTSAARQAACANALRLQSKFGL